MHTTAMPIDRRKEPAGRLLTLTWNAAMRDLHAAEAALCRGDAAAATRDLCQVQRILLELIGALDTSVAPTATGALRDVCQSLFDRLADPAAAGDPATVREIRATLDCIRQACAVDAS